nr:MAG TPA: hypothetical protein [Caudoviricetes sp.]
MGRRCNGAPDFLSKQKNSGSNMIVTAVFLF